MSYPVRTAAEQADEVFRVPAEVAEACAAARAAVQLDIDGCEHEVTAPKSTRRHPAAVTSDRLGRHYDDLVPTGALSAEDAAAFVRVIGVLNQVADGRR